MSYVLHEWKQSPNICLPFIFYKCDAPLFLDSFLFFFLFLLFQSYVRLFQQMNLFVKNYRRWCSSSDHCIRLIESRGYLRPHSKVFTLCFNIESMNRINWKEFKTCAFHRKKEIKNVLLFAFLLLFTFNGANQKNRSNSSLSVRAWVYLKNIAHWL